MRASRGRIDSQISAPPASVRNGTIARLTEAQPTSGVPPEQFINPPEASEATVTPPKRTISLNRLPL